MVFLIEAIVACAVFTIFVFLMSREPIKSIFNYPPAIFDVLLGLLVLYVYGCSSEFLLHSLLGG